MAEQQRVKVIYDPSQVEKKRIFIDLEGNQYDQPTSGLNPKIKPIKIASKEELGNDIGGIEQGVGGEIGK